ncbi:MAG: PAS domain S-box protein [Myxococcales bacterium FL481]|nr:MAG: PAS domain S-box protein [Myxococcales bacterium FL481]
MTESSSPASPTGRGDPVAWLDDQWRLVAGNDAWHTSALPVTPSTEAQEPYLKTLAGLGGELARWSRQLASGPVVDESSVQTQIDKRMLRGSVSPLRRADGTATGYVVRWQDITRRRQRDLALNISRHRLRTVLTSAPIVLFSLDVEGHITLIEGMVASEAGFDDARLVGRSMFEAFSHVPQLLAVVRDALSGRTGTCRVPVGPSTFEFSCGPLHGLDGELRGATGIATDITERQRVEQLRNEFVAVVSHELRTPLTAIHGALKLLETRAAEFDARGASLIEVAQESTSRLIRLVDDLLDFERLDGGRIVLARDAVAVHDWIDAAVREVEAIAAGKRITLRRGEIPRALRVPGDRDRLVQVVVNLLANALRHSPAGGTIELVVESRSPGRLRVSVKDEGPGVDPGIRGALFTRQPLTSGTRGRAGLGLLICKAVVEAHFGHIDYADRPGGGACFYVELPQQLPAGERQHSTDPSSQGINRRPQRAVTLRAPPNPYRVGIVEATAALRDAFAAAQQAPQDDALVFDAHARMRIIAETVRSSCAPVRVAVNQTLAALEALALSPSREAPVWERASKAIARLDAEVNGEGRHA